MYEEQEGRYWPCWDCTNHTGGNDHYVPKEQKMTQPQTDQPMNLLDAYIATRPDLVEDAVNSPSHYMLFPDGTEAIDVIRATLTEEEFRGYCKGNFLKYRLRAGKKDDLEQDIDKSNKYIEFMEKK